MRKVRRVARIAGGLLVGLCLGLVVSTSQVPLKAAPDYICFEAEIAKSVTAPMKIESPSSTSALKGPSGGKLIWVPDNAGDPTHKGDPEHKYAEGDAKITFAVKSNGAYYVWGRCWWTDACGNSFKLKFDDQPSKEITGSTYKKYVWVKWKPDPIVLNAGTHTLTIYNNEDGAGIDQLFLTTDKGEEPAGPEKPNYP